MSLLQTAFGLALLTVGLAPAPALQPSTACKLLQVTEIESAVGGKASKPPVGERDSVPGMVMDVCIVEIPSPSRKAVHRITVQIVSGLPLDGAEAIKGRNGGTAREPQWTTPGARLEQETVGTAICILSGRPNVAGHTICSVPRGKGDIAVDVSGDVQELPSMATVRGLLLKAIARM